MGRFAFLATLVVALLRTNSAFACPLCQSGTGQQVREGIFNNDFGGTLLAMLIPFAVISLVVAVIHGERGRTP